MSVYSSGHIRLLHPTMPGANDLKNYLEEIDRRGIYTNYGPLDTQIRKELLRITGANGVALTSSGTTAITVALMDIKQKHAIDGKASCSNTCIMPSFTFVGTGHAVCNAGLEPVFADIDENSLMITPQTALKAMQLLDTKPMAVVVVSAYGSPIDFDAWVEFKKEYNIPVVFDAAAAFSTFKNLNQDYICVSFHATKIPGMGEGGAIFCRDHQLANELTLRTGFGFSGDTRESIFIGGNFRISEYAAAIGLASLAQLDTNLQILKEKIALYKSKLAQKNCRFLDGNGDQWVSTTLNVVLDKENAQRAKLTLNEAGIPYRHWWGMGCHKNSVFSKYQSASLDVTDAIAPCVLGLPFHRDIPTDHINRVVQCLR